MISLNLLSPEKKQQISKEIIFISTKYLFALSFILVCSASAILLVAEFVVQNNFCQAVSQNTLVTKEYGSLNQNVYGINRQITQLQSMQNKFVIWSNRLVILTNLTPKNIELYSVTINSDTKDINLTGNAKTRDDLLQYKANLENSNLLTGINLPIENLLEANNSYFDIKAKMSF
jgi:Tfp pilus assembly protein PilN